MFKGLKGVFVVLIVFVVMCLQTLSVDQFTLQAQSLESTYDLAVEQYDQENYELASQYFERLVFFDKEKTFSNIHALLADCYFQQKQFDKSGDYYDKAYFLTENDSLKNNYLLKKSYCLLLQQNFSYALIELFNLSDMLSEEQAQQKQLYLGISYFGMEDFEKSENAFLSLSENSNYKNNIEALFDENEKAGKKKPKLAQTLSMIVPGTGQLYAGDVKNGLNSFIINFGLLAIFYASVPQIGFLDSVLLIFPWFQRYYMGGYKAAARITDSKKQDKRAEIYKRMLLEIETQNVLF